MRNLSPSDKLVRLGGTEESFPPLLGRAAFSGEKDESVEHDSPSDDFSAYIELESAPESEEDEAPVAVTKPPEPACCVTRAAAVRAGISVPVYQSSR